MAKPTDSSGKDSALDPALPQKKRARRRLVGAAALCLAAAIGLPLILDHEPRRTTGADVSVEIPSRDTRLPAGGAAAPARAPTVKPEDARQEAPAASASGEARAGRSGPEAGQGSVTPLEPRTEGAPKPADARGDASTATPVPEKRPDARATAPAEHKETKPEAAKAPAQKASEVKPADQKAASDGHRYMLQIGAFASEKGATEQLEKVRAAGLKAYTEKVKTAQGERIRVRVGPFTSRQQAEQARGQLKLVGIDSALIAP
jgi:DedD protein